MFGARAEFGARAVTAGRLRTSVGVIGAAFMAAGGFSYARIPSGGTIGHLDALRDLRAWPGAECWGPALCFAGVALLTVAWLQLGSAVRARQVTVATVHRTALLWALPLVIAPPLFSADAWSYAADGFLTGHGASPYVTPPAVLHGPIIQAVCLCWRHTLAPYGPVPLLWGGAVDQVTSSPWLLMLSYRVLALVGLGLLMYAAPRLARLAGLQAAEASWLAVASPFVLADGVGGAHVDLLLVGLVASALLATVMRGWLAGAVIIGVATAVKAPAVVAGLGVALVSVGAHGGGARLWAAVRVTGVALATAAGLGIVSGLGVGWVRTMHVALVLHTPLSITYEAGRNLRWLLHGDAATVSDAVGVGLTVLGCALLLTRAPVGGVRGPFTAAGIAMLLVTVLSPVTNYWYFLWCLPLLAVCRLPESARRCLVALVLALGLITPLDPSLHVPDGWMIIEASVGAALLVALGWERLADPLRRETGVRWRRTSSR